MRQRQTFLKSLGRQKGALRVKVSLAQFVEQVLRIGRRIAILALHGGFRVGCGRQQTQADNGISPGNGKAAFQLVLLDTVNALQRFFLFDILLHAGMNAEALFGGVDLAFPQIRAGLKVRLVHLVQENVAPRNRFRIQ